MKAKSFTQAKRNGGYLSIRWAKQIRSRIERRYIRGYIRNELYDIFFINKVEDFDILPLAQSKPGYWAWVID